MLIAMRKINAYKQPLRATECRNYAKYNPSAFCDDLRDIPGDDVMKERNVNTAWSNWKELFLNVFDRHAPYKRKIVRGVKFPWFTGETKKLINQRDFSLRKARRPGAEVDWNTHRRLPNQVSSKSGKKNVAITGLKFRKILIAPKPFGKQLRKFFQARKASQRVQNLSRPRRDIQLLISQQLPRSLIMSLQTPSLSFWKLFNSP